MLCGPAGRPAGSSGLALLPLLLSGALLLQLEGPEGREGWVSRGLQAARMLSAFLCLNSAIWFMTCMHFCVPRGCPRCD